MLTLILRPQEIWRKPRGKRVSRGRGPKSFSTPFNSPKDKKLSSVNRDFENQTWFSEVSTETENCHYILKKT